MPDEERPAEEGQEPEQDDSEARFWTRMEEMQDRALDRWAASISAELDAEEAAKPPAKEKEKPKDGPTEGMETDDADGGARRRVEPELRGRGPSGYWGRVGHRILYGDRPRRG